jgi:cystinosin
MMDEQQRLRPAEGNITGEISADDLHAAVGVRAVAPPGFRFGPVRLSTMQAVAAGIALIVASGFILGFGLDPPSKDPEPWARVSAVIGWWYFTAWAISFLPQLYLNFTRKCVVGQSFDYVFMNVLGFFSYSIYTFSFYAVTDVQDEYKARYGNSNNVELNDVVFAVYSFLCCVYNSYQIYAFDRGSQRASKATVAGIAAAVTVMSIWSIAVAAGAHTKYVFNSLDILYGLSILKLGVSLIKYLPQIHLNYKRQCTVGWNIWNVLLDFTGGSLSVAQELIDCASRGDWNGIAGNPVKFCLGSLSMVYDVIFMLQHFVWYRANNERLHKESVAVGSIPDE